MTAFTIHASKDGESLHTVRLGPTITIAKARELLKSGWQVHVTDADGRQYGPDKFDEILRFERKPTTDFSCTDGGVAFAARAGEPSTFSKV